MSIRIEYKKITWGGAGYWKLIPYTLDDRFWIYAGSTRLTIMTKENIRKFRDALNLVLKEEEKQ